MVEHEHAMTETARVSEKFDASPTKGFFIDMITKDITTLDCILDLIDNSLDSYIRQTHMDVNDYLWHGKSRASGSSVEVSIRIDEEDGFTILDNCGGIDWEDALKSVFRLGSPEPELGVAGLGVYGIGMKRAFFKMGNTVKVVSRSDDGEWELVIPSVEEWKGTQDWSFPASYSGPHRKESPLSSPGTYISIRAFREGVRDQIALTAFESDLKERIGKTYALFIRAGVKIRVNGDVIKSVMPEVGFTNVITPFRRRLKRGRVDILVISGIVATEDVSASDAGWYVFCNGRLVLYADKSQRTGWGVEFADFHSKYNTFIGYLCFKSTSPAELPWTTTKQDIVSDSVVYQEGYNEIVSQTPRVLGFLNKAYEEKNESDVALARELRDSAKPVELAKLPQKEMTFNVETNSKQRPENVHIEYSARLKDVERIRERLGRPSISARKIGKMTFEYYLEKECD